MVLANEKSERGITMSRNNGQEQVAGKRFRVAAISSNANSFGLNRFVFVARDGEAWVGHKARQYAPCKQGQVVVLEAPVNRACQSGDSRFPREYRPIARPAS